MFPPNLLLGKKWQNNESKLRKGIDFYYSFSPVSVLHVFVIVLLADIAWYMCLVSQAREVLYISILLLIQLFNALCENALMICVRHKLKQKTIGVEREFNDLKPFHAML